MRFFSLIGFVLISFATGLVACVHEGAADNAGSGQSAVADATPVVTPAQKTKARQEISRGRSLVKSGKQREALMHFKKASQLNPLLALAWLEQATVLLSLGDDEKAIAQALEHARKLAPANPRVDFVSGRFHESFNREKQALAAYHQALQKRQSYPEVLYRAAMLEEHFGQKDAAFTHYRRAYALDPGNSLAAYGAARIAVEHRDYATGAMIYEEMHQHFPKNRLFLERLIDVLKYSQEPEKLRRYQAEYKRRYGEQRHLRDLRPSRR